MFLENQNPNGNYAAVIPKFISQILKNETPFINGDGQQSRDFTYIENVIDANLKACIASSEVAGDTFNVAYGERISLNHMFSILINVIGKEIKPIYINIRSGDIKHSHADISKSINKLGYNPSVSFYDGIKKTIIWFKKNLNK
jgi:UDP-N-acetylglucosamine/UDP-N-acetylgalactosamine 4-epimerase